MIRKIKQLADEAIALQNKNRMDEVLREISALCKEKTPTLAEYGAKYEVTKGLAKEELLGELPAKDDSAIVRSLKASDKAREDGASSRQAASDSFVAVAIEQMPAGAMVVKSETDPDAFFIRTAKNEPGSTVNIKKERAKGGKK